MAADTLSISPLVLAKGIYGFFNFWYIRGAKDFLQRKWVFFRNLEQDMGILINLRMLFQPIYGDYTFAGRLIGPVFRLLRVSLGLALLFFCAILIVLIFAIRLMLPLVAFFMVIENVFFLLAG